MNTDKVKTLTVREQYGLVTSNPAVQKLATRLRWKPERAITRIERALPAPMEQQIYLAIASDFGILPETMAKLLRIYLGYQHLQLEDVVPRQVGKNLTHSKFGSFAEFLRECLNLLKIVSKEYSAFQLTVADAATIVLHYGTEDPERLIEIVDANLEELCDVLGMNNETSYEYRMRVCTWIVVTKIIPRNRNLGIPDILDPTAFLEMSSDRRHQLRRALSQEVPDYLSADADEMRSYPELDLLKREGII